MEGGNLLSPWHLCMLVNNRFNTLKIKDIHRHSHVQCTSQCTYVHVGWKY